MIKSNDDERRKRKCLRITLRLKLMMLCKKRILSFKVAQQNIRSCFIIVSTFNKNFCWGNFKGIPEICTRTLWSPRENPLKRCLSETNKIDENSWLETTVKSDKRVFCSRDCEKRFSWFICGASTTKNLFIRCSSPWCCRFAGLFGDFRVVDLRRQIYDKLSKSERKLLLCDEDLPKK